MILNTKLATVAMFGLVFVTSCGANTATNMNANTAAVPTTIEVNANGMTDDIMMNTNSMLDMNTMDTMSGAMMDSATMTMNTNAMGVMMNTNMAY